jgi:hypothetical protein
MHILNVVLGLVAVFGVILMIIGRMMILGEACAVGPGWVWAIRLLPLADLMFLARFWDTAKSGAFTSLFGLALTLPFGAKALYETKQHAADEQVLPLGVIDNDTKATLYQEMKTHRDECIRLKQRKFEQLNTYMTAWYQSLESRRATVTDATPEQLAIFNEEAAAYTAMRAMTKEEADELAAMRATSFEFADVKMEDYMAWLRRSFKFKQPRHEGRPGGDAGVFPKF